jgi:3-oxoadipate enol-lactonase
MSKLSIQNINIHYESVGQGDPLLLLHGLGSSTRDWEKQIAFFSKNYQVITVDIRGHGQSDKPPGPYSIALFAADIAELINILDIKPVHVVGISMGGMIAYQLAATHHQLVKSMTIVNATPEFVVRTFKERFNVFQRQLIVRLLGMRKIGKVLSKRLFIKPEQEELRTIFIERWAENDSKTYLKAMKAIVGWSVVDKLKNIDCPTLILAADEDYTSVEEKKKFASIMNQAEISIIKDSRHATPIEHPKLFNQTVIDFLNKQS